MAGDFRPPEPGAAREPGILDPARYGPRQWGTSLPAFLLLAALVATAKLLAQTDGGLLLAERVVLTVLAGLVLLAAVILNRVAAVAIGRDRDPVSRVAREYVAGAQDLPGVAASHGERAIHWLLRFDLVAVAIATGLATWLVWRI